MQHHLRLILCTAIGVSLPALTGCNQPVAAKAQSGDSGNGKPAKSEAKTGIHSRIKEVRTEHTTSPRTTTQPARIEPFEESPLYAKIDGYVLKTRKVTGGDREPVDAPIADIGDRLADGDVLAEIWIPEMEQELRQKLALLAQATAERDQAVQAIIVAQKAAESARARISEANAGVVRADGDYERWKDQQKRIQKLADGGSVSQELADETLNQFRAADASRRVAAARVKSTKAAFGEAEANVLKAKADEAAARARLQVAQANVDYVQVMLDYAKIRAPFAGVVTERNVDTGHLVRPPQGNTSRPLFVVARTDIVRIITDIPELETPLVDIGDRAFIRVQALGKEEIEGKVTRTSWTLNPATRTLRTEIHLPNPSGLLRSGMYATVRIILEDNPPARGRQTSGPPDGK